MKLTTNPSSVFSIFAKKKKKPQNINNILNRHKL